MPPHLILVPGFLGFQRLRALSYFTDVEALLEQPFAEAGRMVTVQAIRTLPTSSLGARAARLAEVVHGLPIRPRSTSWATPRVGSDEPLVMAREVHWVQLPINGCRK